MGRSLIPFNDVLESAFADAPARWATEFTPRLDVAEGDDAFVIRMDVPGVKREDLNIELRDGVLTIRGHREYTFDGSAEGLRHFERSSGTFQRAVYLPKGADDVQADLADGVLTLTVAKPEEAKPRRIEIGQPALEAAATE